MTEIRVSSPGDHDEADMKAAAAVTDRGLRHARNEDAYALAREGEHFAAVVCDGVSSSANPDLAAGTAAGAMIEVLATVLAREQWPPKDILVPVIRQAVEAGANAVAGVAVSERGAPPATTAVAALVGPGLAVLSGVGDSRVYWLDPEPRASRRLTVDDSWAEAAVELGVPAEAAYAAPGAHIVTQWLGPGVTELAPRVVVVDIESPGTLVACSDGLWNYFESAEALSALAAGAPTSKPLDLARHFTRAAIEAGGADNITVAVISVGTAEPD